jgi:hypothetical protein
MNYIYEYDENNEEITIFFIILIFIFIIIIGIIIIVVVKIFNLQLNPSKTSLQTSQYSSRQKTGIFDTDVNIDVSGSCYKRPLYDSDFFKKIYNNNDDTLVFY